MRRLSRRAPTAFVLAVVLACLTGLLAGCQAFASAKSASIDPADAAWSRMSPAERIGQLFMIGVPSTGASATQLQRIAGLRIGNVTLIGRSQEGVAATAGLVRRLKAVTNHNNVLPFIATDQEGGEVQDLSGQGFSRMPTALTQGTQPLATLRANAKRWAAQLVLAGVNLDLAPVGDTVPADVGTDNQPIGRYHREFGYTTTRVSSHVQAFIAGMRQSNENTCIKHFPGLGRATGNTDSASSVTDPTTRHDSYLAPYRTAIAAGVPFVMVSTARYPHIDPYRVAAFSHTVVTSMLRQDLGFRGVIVSDSLTSTNVSNIPAGARATRYLEAGGDMILITSLTSAQVMIDAVKAMTATIREQMLNDPSFASTVKAAVLAILRAKAKAGLLRA